MFKPIYYLINYKEPKLNDCYYVADRSGALHFLSYISLEHAFDSMSSRGILPSQVTGHIPDRLFSIIKDKHVGSEFIYRVETSLVRLRTPHKD
ncbi:hypothetical protein ACFLZX_06590 [Nanoarchaeota archaeon]